MPAELSNALLQQAQDKVEAGLTPENRQNYNKIVVAGMHAAMSKGPDSILATLRQSADPISDAAKGAISLVLILRREAHGIMPLKAMVPAGMTLMLKALDFADRAGIAKVGNAELVRATHIFTDVMFARFGITRQGLANAATKVHAITQNPAQMELINRKAGIVRSPGASGPAPTPSASAGMINGPGS